jgi:hypothetical protein
MGGMGIVLMPPFLFQTNTGVFDMAIVLRTKSDMTYPIEIEGSTFFVTPLSNAETTKLRKKFERPNRSGGVDFDLDGFYQARLKRVIKDWKGVVDENGAPLKCDDENKYLLGDLNLQLALDILKRAEEINAEEAVELEKN